MDVRLWLAENIPLQGITSLELRKIQGFEPSRIRHRMSLFRTDARVDT
jgi:hypothetical protein